MTLSFAWEDDTGVLLLGVDNALQKGKKTFWECFSFQSTLGFSLCSYRNVFNPGRMSYIDNIY